MKVIFLTNVIRRMGMMQQTMEKLQQEGKLDNACACRWLPMRRFGRINGTRSCQAPSWYL